MNQTPISTTFRNRVMAAIPQLATLQVFFAGLLIPCGFAPIHIPGLAILGIALLFAQLRQNSATSSFQIGFIFGLGFFGFGVSWVYISINTYGHLNPIVSAFFTLLFVAYLAIFPGLVTWLYHRLANKQSLLLNSLIFSALWTLSEWLRANFLTGFPWLLLGVGQFDSPLKWLLPVIGIYGVSFITCLIATWLTIGLDARRNQRHYWIIGFVMLLLAPMALKQHTWTKTQSTTISTSVIQPNISMRDKWDEALFWEILRRYEHEALQLIGKKQLIIMPESAIPVPINYISDYLADLDLRAKSAGSAILFGVPQATIVDSTTYHNTLSTMGTAQGTYLKQHLVPFGEFMPKIFEQLSRWLALPPANLKPGKQQAPIMVQNYPIASLICYEVAYPQILRTQLPNAQWIVSISDDGWFGHSFAVYQQLQMSQVLSIQTGRYQIVANNDGLSSVINTFGDILDSLPAFSAGTLNASLNPSTGATPWVSLGDNPILLFSILIMLLALGVRNLPLCRGFVA